MREGARVVLRAQLPAKLIVALLFALTLLMLPVGRGAVHEHRKATEAGYTREADAGSLLAPLAFDSGLNFRLRPGADFFAIYEAGLRARSGDDPYSAGLEAPRRAPYATQFRYPVITAYWLGAPLSLLPPWVAYGFWIGACVAMLIANYLLCVGRSPKHAILLAVIWFAWFPVVPELHMGQFSLLVATLLLWSADAFLAGRRWGGIPWLLAATVKVFPLAWAPVLWRIGRRRAAIVVTLLLVGSAALSLAVFPSGRSEGILSGGIFGKVIAKTHQPYAGAQGLQSAINAVCWKLSGKGFNDPSPDPPIPNLSDPTLILSILIIAAYCAFALLAIVRMAAHPSAKSLAALLALLWLAWFVAFRDNWEHHYVLVQALAALLLSRGVLTGRQAIMIWCFAGAPSLWFLWQKLGGIGGGVSEVIGVLYFFQRPVALLILFSAIANSLHSNSAARNTETNLIQGTSATR